MLHLWILLLWAPWFWCQGNSSTSYMSWNTSLEATSEFINAGSTNSDPGLTPISQKRGVATMGISSAEYSVSTPFQWPATQSPPASSPLTNLATPNSPSPSQPPPSELSPSKPTLAPTQLPQFHPPPSPSQSPSSTSQPPSSTSQPPPSQPPSSTSQPPPSQPPSSTSQPPSSTSHPPRSTSQPISSPSQPPSSTSQPPSSPSQPPSSTSQPISSTSQPPSSPSQPPSSTSHPPRSTSQPISSPSQPPSSTSQPPSSPSQPPSSTSQPPSSTSQPPSSPSQPPSSTSQPPSSTSQPPPLPSQPPQSPSQPPSSTSQPPSSPSQPPSSTSQPPPSLPPPSPSSAQVFSIRLTSSIAKTTKKTSDEHPRPQPTQMAPTQMFVLSSHSTGKSRVPALSGTNDMAPGKPSQNDEEYEQRRKVVTVVFSSSCAIVALAGLVCAGRYFWKKQRHKKRQMNLSNWAGQSPFLHTEGEIENCKLVHQGDTRRVSFTSILPYPLYKESRSIEELQLIEASSMGITFGKDGMGELRPDQAANGSPPPPGADQPPGESKHAEGEEIAEGPAGEETAGCTQGEKPKAAEDTMAGGTGEQPPQEVPAPSPTQASAENQPSPPT